MACCDTCHELMKASEAERWKHISGRTDHAGTNGRFGLICRSRVVEVFDGNIHLTGHAAQEYVTNKSAHLRAMNDLYWRLRRLDQQAAS
jgi:hypothetical protein